MPMNAAHKVRDYDEWQPVFGVLEALQILLEAGVDPNTPGGEYGNALQAIAAHKGSNMSALRQLLDWGADVNMEGGKFGNALVAAAATELLPGSEELELNWVIIQLLMDYGADVYAEGWVYGSALGASVAMQDYISVRILMEWGGSPLGSGSYEGRSP